MQLVVTGAMKKAGFAENRFTSHTLRHSFATHMLDNGSNIHVIKTLLGHSKLENHYGVFAFTATYTIWHRIAPG